MSRLSNTRTLIEKSSDCLTRDNLYRGNSVGVSAAERYEIKSLQFGAKMNFVGLHPASKISLMWIPRTLDKHVPHDQFWSTVAESGVDRAD